MTSVEIHVGRDWQRDVRYLHELRDQRPLDAPLHLSEILDIVDIVVDDRNLTSSVARESIFPLFADLLEALVALYGGEAPRLSKAIVPFQCEPLELVLVPREGSLAISLYTVGHEVRVIARDLCVDATSFVRTTGDAVEQMLADLFRISESFASEPSIRRLSGLLASLRRLDKIGGASGSVPDVPHPSEGRRTVTTSCGPRLTLRFEYDADDRPLRSYDGIHASDLHALLFDGELVVESGDETAVLREGRPFPALYDFVRRARGLLGELEGSARSRPRRVVQAAGLPVVDTDDGRVWKLRLGPAPTFEFELAPRVCIDQLLSVAEVVLEDLFELNPRLRLDRRASDLDDEVRELRAWLESTTVGNQYLDAPERFLADFGHLTAQTGPASPPAAGFAWPFAQVRRLHPSHAWTFCAPRIGFRDIAPTRHGLVVPAGERIVCLDWSDGVERWSYEAAGVDRAGCHVSGDCVVVGTGGEESVPRVLDLGRGESLFELRDAGGLGRPACIARYDSESLLVSIGADGVALGSDTAMGVARWRTELGGPRLHDAVASGPVLCALAENGALSTVHPLDGSLLWRVYLEGGEPFALRVHQGRLYAFMLDLERGRIHIYALYPFSGRTVRHWRLEGSPAGGPQFFDDRMIVAVERHGRLWLLGLATEEERSWRRELHSVGFDGPSRARAVRVDGRRCIVVRTDRGELSCISLNDGALAWRVEPVDEHGLMYSRPGLEQVRDCILTVGTSLEFRRVSDGSLVHRFTRLVHTPRFLCAVGELDVVVGESSEGEGGVDRLVDLRFGHFVAEV